MTERLSFLWPEIILFFTTCVVMVLGLSRTYRNRKATAWMAGLGVAIAGGMAAIATPTEASMLADSGQLLLPGMPPFIKPLIAIVGLMLLLLLAGTVDRQDEEKIAAGKASFDPLRSNRAEFYAFYLFSLTGLMLCASADDLIWLFLALELTSLPTYIMVTISTQQSRSREAGVKYFFLGALGAAIFLYGFALIYGGTGTTNLNEIREAIVANGLNSLTLAGVLLAVLGMGFKIASVPMHYYTADVYEGAAPQVSAFLAFVPKTAGFIGILLLCAAVGWDFGPGNIADGPLAAGSGDNLPNILRVMLWVVAALTMTVGNALALLQTSVKRILAYSSIAHSGYMLVGVIAGPGNSGRFTENGVSAVLFYLLAYGVMNLGAFAVIAALEGRRNADGEHRQIESMQDLRGLCSTHPALGWSMVLTSLSLLGLPPLLGFFGKLPLFTAGIAAGEISLVIILGINSAIAAVYYLRLAFVPLLEKADPMAEPMTISPFRSRSVAALLSAGGVVTLAVFAGTLMEQTREAGIYTPEKVAPLPRAPRVTTPADEPGEGLPIVDATRTNTGE